MTNAHLRTPYTVSTNNFVTRKTFEAIEMTGRGLPCSVTAINNGIVTVKFEINQPGITLPSVSMPVAQFPYCIMPIQVGDKGYTAPADAYLGGVSGLGGGVADLSQRANLSTLVFTPISNTSFNPPDSNAVCIKGVGSSGAIISSGTTGCNFVLNHTGITITIGSTTISMSSSGITVTNGDVIAGTISLQNHLTSEVQSGSGKSGPPVAS